jgi:hypothetical protein
MKKLLVVLGLVSVIVSVSVFVTRPVHGQTKTARSGVQTAAKTGSNCTSNTCSPDGGCASCKDLEVSLPDTAQIIATHCLTNANYPKDYEHYDLHEVPCGKDVSWSIFENPDVNGSVVRTRFHNRSSDRDRDVELTVDYQ